MSSTALTMMIVTQGIFTLVTAYFFWRVLKAPKKAEPDSFNENDED
jgi:hypothetical protein